MSAGRFDDIMAKVEDAQRSVSNIDEISHSYTYTQKEAINNTLFGAKDGGPNYAYVITQRTGRVERDATKADIEEFTRLYNKGEIQWNLENGARSLDELSLRDIISYKPAEDILTSNVADNTLKAAREGNNGHIFKTDEQRAIEFELSAGRVDLSLIHI